MRSLRHLHLYLKGCRAVYELVIHDAWSYAPCPQASCTHTSSISLSYVPFDCSSFGSACGLTNCHQQVRGWRVTIRNAPSLSLSHPVLRYSTKYTPRWRWKLVTVPKASLTNGCSLSSQLILYSRLLSLFPSTSDSNAHQSLSTKCFCYPCKLVVSFCLQNHWDPKWWSCE